MRALFLSILIIPSHPPLSVLYLFFISHCVPRTPLGGNVRWLTLPVGEEALRHARHRQLPGRLGVDSLIIQRVYCRPGSLAVTIGHIQILTNNVFFASSVHTHMQGAVSSGFVHSLNHHENKSYIIEAICSKYFTFERGWVYFTHARFPFSSTQGLSFSPPPSCTGTTGDGWRGSGASLRGILLFRSLAMGKGRDIVDGFGWVTPAAGVTCILIRRYLF